MAKKFRIKSTPNFFIKTCPACGYSFRSIDPKIKKNICPMCGYKIIEPHISPDKSDQFEKRI